MLVAPKILIKYKLHYFFAWLLVFGIWFFFRYQGFASPLTAFKVTLIKVLDLAIMVSFCNYLLIPQLLYKKRYVLFVTSFIVMILASSFIKMYIIGTITNNVALLNWTSNWKPRFYDNVIPHFFLVMAGAAIKLMIDYSHMQQRMIELAKDKAEAELNFLKSQINPHFLFNSLNTVYFQIDKNNQEARDTLHKFSEMLRYQLYEMNGKQIPIEKELRFLEDYVDLQKMRKDDRYQIEFICAENVKGFSIEPLLLVPLVENAFKHVSSSPEKLNYISIRASRNDGHFIFAVENSLDQIPSASDPHKGIGLQNVRRRLELLYPDTHQMQVETLAGSYRVILDIKTN